MAEQRTVRVLPGPDPDSLWLFDRERYEPVIASIPDSTPEAADLRPGYLADVELDWTGEAATVEAVSVARPTLYTVADEITPVFELAEDVWQEAQAENAGMNSRLARDTDGEVVGVCYVFAEGPLDDRLAEFREGTRPLEPLVDRVNEEGDPAPRSVFVLRPIDAEFVIVTIALQKGGQFAETLRDTYDCPTPDEPLLE